MGRALAQGACVLMCFVCLATVAWGDEAAPVQAWRQQLSRIENDLRRVPAGNAAARDNVAQALDQLRQEVADWLATYPPAQQGGTPWLEPRGAAAGEAELAAEVSRLRAAISRIDTAQQGSDSGAFYIGRIDVAVTAEVPVLAASNVTPAGASVVTAKELEAHDRLVLSDALTLAPGVTFSRIGQKNETTVYVRGFDNRQVPVFIDGIPIYTPYDGYADLSRFTTFDMAEIQVSKGFTSVLYGPNALGGAINIVSRQPTGKIEGVGGASYGMGDARNLYVNAGSRLGAWYVQGSASYLAADTFPLADGFTAVKTQAAGDRLNAYRRDSKVNVKLGYTPNGAGEYAISYVGQRGEKGNPPYAGTDTSVKTRYWQWPSWDKDSLYVISNTPLGAASYVRGRAYYDQYTNELYSYDDATYTTQAKGSSFKSDYRDHTVGGSVEWGTTLGPQTLRAAGHVKRDFHQNRNQPDPYTDFVGQIMSLGVEDTIVVSPRVSMVGGISVDRQTMTTARDYLNKQFIDQPLSSSSGVNPQAGLFVSAPGGGLLRLTLARKTRFPSLSNRYSYKFGTAVPNPDLAPERSTTLESGYQGTLGRQTSFQASVFYSRIADLIQTFYLQPNLSQQQNIGRVSHAGVELDARTRLLKAVELGASYAFIRRENLSAPTIPLVFVPRHKGVITATVEPAAFLRLTGDVNLEGGRTIQNESGRYLDVPSFATANVKATWIIHKQLDAEVSVLNATDKNYWVVDGFPEPGRIVMVNLRCRF
jgi:iron complex outermembrane receptor protein